MGYLVLRSNALFCAAASVGKLLFIRPSTSKPKPSVINTSARVMFRGCASSSIVRGLFMFPPRSPSHLITALLQGRAMVSRAVPYYRAYIIGQDGHFIEAIN